MTRRSFTAAAAVLLAIGAAVRVHNALTFPLLTSYDGFAHFTYVWYLAATGRVPLPTAGWEFFQPPLYYAGMAVLWDALRNLDPDVRLHVGVGLVAVASLIHAAVVTDVLRRRAPEARLQRLITLAFMLFLPVGVYGAGFLGNEGACAVLCSGGLAALFAHLRRPTALRAAALGFVLGLALLTKITAIAVAVGALATIVAKGLAERRPRPAIGHAAILLAVMVATSGWYYERNVKLYGTPFVMSRRELVLRLIEDSQPQARRALAEYLLFDPLILRRPMWPRGADAPNLPGGWSGAVRDSVWTGLYANTWFDGFGGWTVPHITGNETARHAGQLLLCLGVVPTLLVIVGFLSALVGLVRRGFDDVRAVVVFTLVPMLAIFIVGTRSVPIAAAVKATYLLPASVAFGLAFALGLEWVALRRARVVRFVAVDLALASAIAVGVFWHGLLFSEREIFGSWPLIHASTADQYGVVYYAAGDRAAARAHFERAAADDLYLGYENLALLAFEDERTGEALHLLKRAIRLQPRQSPGQGPDRALYDRITAAEYWNLVSVFEHARGRMVRAEGAAAAAVARDPTLPEAHFDLAVAMLARADRGGGGVPATLARARSHLDRAVALDPGFAEAAALRAIVDAVAAGDRADAATGLVLRRAAPGDRLYPVETGIGAPYAASIGRRRHVTDLPETLEMWRRYLLTGS